MKHSHLSVVLFILSILSCSTVNREAERGVPDPKTVLRLMGAKGQDGVSTDKVEEYRNLFSRLDENADGCLTRHEYVERGRYATRRVRAAIFAATDRDTNSCVSCQEYVENRIITDEAKLIMRKLDSDGDGMIQKSEFLSSGGIEDRSLAEAVFREFDGDGDGELKTPEYLRVWGRWARSGKPNSSRGEDN